MAVVVLKLAPVIVKLKGCPATAGLGVGVMAVSCGVPDTGAETVSDTEPDAVPLALFCTVTVKVPLEDSTAEPFNWVEEPVNWFTVHGVVHPGPEKEATAVDGVKLLPVRVKVNGDPETGGLGEVVMAVN